jgi:hypothetical protein
MENKHIEEMAKETMKHCKIDNQCGSCHWSTCNECLSEALYNAGYRKADEVVEEIFEELLGIISSKYAAVTTDCHYNMRFGNVDTPNGMRDLGKAETLKYVGDKIAELKKKYTESEDTE